MVYKKTFEAKKNTKLHIISFKNGVWVSYTSSDMYISAHKVLQLHRRRCNGFQVNKAEREGGVSE